MPPLNKHEQWRDCADSLKLEAQERFRVEWMIYYEKEAEWNAGKTCEHFGISKKTFYKWLNRFIGSSKDIESLKNISRKPHVLRSLSINETQEDKILNLRNKYMHYGKNKLKILYKKKYGEEISCWKIERVIRKHKLYPDKKRQSQIAGKFDRARVNSKRSFTKLEKNKNLWFLFRMDILAIYWGNTKRYILTAVDHYSKLGYARMYKTKSQVVEYDFLHRLNHLIQQPLENIATGSEKDFTQHFDIAFNKLKTNIFFSWVNTPKHGTGIERFIKTLEYEWLFDGNLDVDCSRFNKNLTSWLIEYNFKRPHQNLNYLTPIEYIKRESKKARLKKRISPADLVERITDYIKKLEIAEIETLSVDRISMDLNVDRKKIWRYFKKEDTITLKEHIFRIKIIHATHLLRYNPELTVKQVAEKIGYNSYSYFIQIFKEHLGFTPGKYRESEKKK
ncbi:MAG: helix-turn-helix domain-containing protein [Candidatus Aminicenantes bacterium]|nr:helix-turn-helix domain-containing protein [Candidatus Aminicenantes bacterium]